MRDFIFLFSGCFIGRGRGMKDVETLFTYGVTLNELTVWQISGNSFEELPCERHGIFYSAEGNFIIMKYLFFFPHILQETVSQVATVEPTIHF